MGAHACYSLGMNGSLSKLIAAADDEQRFSAEERDVLFSALVDAVRQHEGRYQVFTDGEWRDNAVADRLAGQGMFASDGTHIAPADEAMLLLGFMVKRRALSMEVGEREANMVCAERLWDGPMVGEADHVLLTGDGRGYDRSGGWCQCVLGGQDTDWDQMVQFERWSKRGREGHGWLHRVCRRLYQAG